MGHIARKAAAPEVNLGINDLHVVLSSPRDGARSSRRHDHLVRDALDKRESTLLLFGFNFVSDRFECAQIYGNRPQIGLGHVLIAVLNHLTHQALGVVAIRFLSGL